MFDWSIDVIYISVTETRRRCLFRLCEDYNLFFLSGSFVCVCSRGKPSPALFQSVYVCESEFQTALSLQENGRQSNTNTRIYTQKSYCIALLRCFPSRFLMHAHAMFRLIKNIALLQEMHVQRCI